MLTLNKSIRSEFGSQAHTLRASKASYPYCIASFQSSVAVRNANLPTLNYLCFISVKRVAVVAEKNGASLSQIKKVF